jgi:hypothetical protein
MCGLLIRLFTSELLQHNEQVYLGLQINEVKFTSAGVTQQPYSTSVIHFKCDIHGEVLEYSDLLFFNHITP